MPSAPSENTDIRRSARIRSGRVLANLTNRTSSSSSSGRVTKRARLSEPEVPAPVVSTTATCSSSSSTTSSSRRRSSRSTSRSRASTSTAQTIEPAGPVYECDIADKNSPHMATEYINDLYAYHKEIEATKAVTLYMQTQTDINARMRAILIDWLVEVHLKFKLVPATLHLCVSIIDQYCSKNVVPRSKLQLVGVTALLIACKYEEIYPPEVRDCVFITDNAYPREEVLEMEMKMLIFFGYNVTCPSAHPFLVRFLRIAGHTVSNSRTTHRASYYAERCLQEHDMLEYKPSLLAASAIYLAQRMENETNPWNKDLEQYTGYSLDEVLPCAKHISEHVNRNPVTASRRPLHAVRRKFENLKYMGVAEELPPLL